MKIQHVYVTGYRGDVRFTRCAVASIRCWYPDIPVTLVKDLGWGDYDTRDLERHWDVRIYQTPRKRFGPAGKIELLCEGTGERFLAIDSDIVFLGRVLDTLDEFPEDLVVNGWNGSEDVDAYFYDVERLHELMPDVDGRGRAFNAGQFVATSGVMKREDFKGLIDFSDMTRHPTLLRPDIFRNLDQGPLNAVALAKHKRRELTIRWHSYMWWAGSSGLEIDLACLRNEGYPTLLHWAGFTERQWYRLHSAPVLAHFERLYYSRLPGPTRARIEDGAQWLAATAASLVKPRLRRLLTFR